MLILENGLAMREQAILEDILAEIGRSNNLCDFPTKLPFDEANIRLVNFNNAALQKEDKVRPGTWLAHLSAHWLVRLLPAASLHFLPALTRKRLSYGSMGLKRHLR